MRYLDYKIAYRWDDVQMIKDGLFPYPKSLTIFPSEVCNLKCIGCNSKSIHRKNGFMDFDLFKTIVDDFVWNMNGKAVAFEGGGEPMLHPRIGEMINYLVGKELKIGIITNGTIFKKEMLLADWIRVSIPNAFGILPKVKDNIDKLMRERNITTIGVKFLRSKICKYPEHTYIHADYIQYKDLRNSRYSFVPNPKYVKPCGLTQLRAVVDYDGTFYPCPYFHAQKHTSISKGVLSDIWGSENHRKAIKNIKNCNLYDCPLQEIDWETFKKTDLEFI